MCGKNLKFSQFNMIGRFLGYYNILLSLSGQTVLKDSFNPTSWIFYFIIIFLKFFLVIWNLFLIYDFRILLISYFRFSINQVGCKILRVVTSTVLKLIVKSHFSSLKTFWSIFVVVVQTLMELPRFHVLFVKKTLL